MEKKQKNGSLQICEKWYLIKEMQNAMRYFFRKNYILRHFKFDHTLFFDFLSFIFILLVFADINFCCIVREQELILQTILTSRLCEKCVFHGIFI